MNENLDAAFRKARAEGRAYYSLRNVFQQSYSGICADWSELTPYVNERGEPVADINRNTVVDWQSEALDETNPKHRVAVEEWYG